MTIPIAATGRELQRSNRHVASRETCIWKDYAKTKVELAAALLRERELLREKSALLQRQDMLAQEFEHRLLNSLQVNRRSSGQAVDRRQRPTRPFARGE